MTPRAFRRRGTTAKVPWPLAVMLSLPALVGIIIVFLVPFIGTIRLSFTTWFGVGEAEPVGLRNYDALFSDPTFYSSIRVTVLYTLLSALGIVILATVTAMSVRRGRLATVLRIVWFLPAIAPGTAVAVFWAFALQPVSGAVNGLLGIVGLGDTHAWLASPRDAIYVVIAVTIWAGVAFPFLLIVGAIERVAPEIYEAAQLDGAGATRQAFHITLPLIRPVLAMVTVLELIWNFNSFTTVWAMTKGGPAEATNTLPVRLYVDAFQNFEFGEAAALGVMTSVVLVVIGLVGLRFANRSAV